MSQSLREIAERMDPDKPARRLYGNGPPFASSRPQPYDLDNLSFDFATVDVDDSWVPGVDPSDPPKTRVVSGPVDLEAIEEKVIYDGIRYLEAASGTAPSGTTRLSGDESHSSQDVYEYNLFFADQNAYDLGMINRTEDNSTLPEGYTDKGIIENHRWTDPAESSDVSEPWRSIRNLVDRHRKGVWHRILSQNMKLPLTSGVLGARRDRAEKLGKRFSAAGFDIVGMCEVPNETLLKHVKKGYDSDYSDIDRRWAKKDLSVLVGGRRQADTTTARNIVHAESKQFENSGGSPGTSASKEGWLRVVIEVSVLPGNPKFEVFVTHLQPVVGHAPNKDKQLQAKISQMRELRDEIAERNRETPQQPKIVMGDFNIRSGGRPSPMGSDSGVEKGEYFNNFMHQMHSVGMQNIWLTHGGPGPPDNKCPNKEDGYLCDPFRPKNKNYYQGGHVDYVFVEKPRTVHELHIDISRTKMTGWPKSGSGYLTDHPGIAFDILTSPPD